MHGYAAITTHTVPAPDGFTACWWRPIDRYDRLSMTARPPWRLRAVEVEHTATGVRGRGTARDVDTALAAALRLCRARMAMARRARHPMPLVRSVDLIAEPDLSVVSVGAMESPTLAAMDAGDLGAGRVL